MAAGPLHCSSGGAGAPGGRGDNELVAKSLSVGHCTTLSLL